MSNGTSQSYAAFASKEPLREWTFDLRPLEDDIVEIEIAYCGICHSDIHTVTGGWGDQKWPVVPGHEIIGYVTQVGSKVTKFKVGDRVGVGAQGNACLNCSECHSKSEPYCSNAFGMTYGHTLPSGYVTKGGYAYFHRAHSHFVVKIPDALPSAAAAPLLCAGITCYSPLKFANAGPGKKVGIVGIGGLGHLGVKLAVALGADVYAISTSDSKKAEALGFGAKGFLNLKNQEELNAHARSFDVILNTASAIVDLTQLFNLIKTHGTLTNVGAPEEPLKLNLWPFFRHINFNATMVGPPSQIEEMLQLCAEKKVTAQIEIAPFEEVNEAMAKVNRNEARYRIVLAINDALDQKHRSK